MSAFDNPGSLSRSLISAALLIFHNGVNMVGKLTERTGECCDGATRPRANSIDQVNGFFVRFDPQFITQNPLTVK